ncbi:ligase [Lithospermum erythrorhizon]|uniref:Ligase n=1 Tax=Lithospermum erythrorhizon TaxID=34254 RepID=A0AAV3NSQ4_LITER
MTHHGNSVVTISAKNGSCKTGLQFAKNVLLLAHGLIGLGLKRGGVVAISALNSDLYLEWMLAVAYVGGVVAPLNYRWSLEEAILAMNQVRPVMLVIDSSSNYWHSGFRVELIPSLLWKVLMDTNGDQDCSFCDMLTTESLRTVSSKFASFSPCWAQEDGEGVVLICFTSGTTGRPKGVMINHIALIVQSLAKLEIVGYREDDIYLHTAPLCHIGGISSAMAMLMVGGCHVFIPKFDAISAIDAITHYQVTSMITVPTMMADIVYTFKRKKIGNGLESMKKVLNGGGSLTLQSIEETINIFPKARLISAYGMTEACSSLTFKTLYDPKDEKSIGNQKSTSIFQSGGVCVGKPAPHIELRIEVENSSHVGRILTRGPHVMIGYWGNFQLDATNPINEGWLDTGDIGQIDGDGDLWLVGRNKGRIKSGGENIYPEEVENVLLQHPGVAAVVVVGVPDTRLTEMVVACVHIKDDWRWVEFSSTSPRNQNSEYLSANILQQFCKEMNMTGFKIPRRFVPWKSPFPVTSTGKIKREQVRTDVSSNLNESLSKL